MAMGLDFLAGAATRTMGAAMELAPALARTNPPTLSPNPKSLFNLWDEYLNGIGGVNLQGCSLNPSKGGSSKVFPTEGCVGYRKNNWLIWGTLQTLP